MQRRHILRAHLERWCRRRRRRWCRGWRQGPIGQLQCRTVIIAALWPGEVALEIRHVSLVNVVQTACAAHLCRLTALAVVADAMLYDELVPDRTAVDLADLTGVLQR